MTSSVGANFPLTMSEVVEWVGKGELVDSNALRYK